MANNTEYFWNRIGYVEIENDDGEMVRFGGSHDGLDFKFDIQYTGDVATRFTCGILGLGMDTIQRLTVWNFAQAMSRQRKIAIYAGYEKDGLARQVAYGIITRAIPTSPPEMWLNFECLIGSPSFDPSDGKCLKDKTVAEILDVLAKMNSFDSRWDAKTVPPTKKVKHFYVGEAPVWLITKFASRIGVLIYTDGSTLVAADKYAWLTNEVVKAEDVINVYSGLLAIGNIDLKGATIQCRLNTKARLMTWIRVESVIMPSANNNYYVIAKRHVGHYRGKEWYTELQMIRRPAI